jgi:hypothetical protein
MLQSDFLKKIYKLIKKASTEKKSNNYQFTIFERTTINKESR